MFVLYIEAQPVLFSRIGQFPVLFLKPLALPKDGQDIRVMTNNTRMKKKILEKAIDTIQECIILCNTEEYQFILTACQAAASLAK